MKLVLKGSATSGWYSPPRGDHTGAKHRAAGSGKAAVAVKKKPKLVAKPVVKKKPATVVPRSIFTGMMPAQKDAATAIIREAGIPASDLEGLTITTKVPPLYAEKRGQWYKRGETITGLYMHGSARSGAGDVYVHPSRLGPKSTTLIHEIGHHKMRRYFLRMGLAPSGKVKARLVFAASGVRDRSPLNCAKMGLRKYSGANYMEFFADAYMCKYCGTPAQWSALKSYGRRRGVNLDEAFA